MHGGMSRLDGGMSSIPVPPGGAEFDPAAEAIFAAFTTPPTDARKILINDFVVALKDGGVWDLLLVLHILAAADAQASLINWKTPGTFNATLVSTPTFTADRGYTGNGTTTALSSAFVPSTNGGAIYVQNSAHASVRSLSDIAGNNANRPIGMASVTSPRVLVNTRNAANQLGTILNSGGGGANVALATTLGHFIVSRTAAAVTQRYHNGAAQGTSVDASTGLPTDTIHYLRDATNFAAMQIASASIGGALDDSHAATLYNAELAYMQAVGAV